MGLNHQYYFKGTNDIVRCCVCDGGLQKWSAGDDPWVEHARWFPHCAYVRQVKGEDYIELIRLSAEQDRLEEVGHVQVQTSLIGGGGAGRSSAQPIKF